MNGAEIIKALGGKWRGRDGFARCPVHANGKERTPSLHVSEKGGRLLVRCMAGCEQADVIEALRARGLWPDRNCERNTRARPASGPAEPDAQKRSAAALAIWRAAQSTAGTLVETYLRSRGVTLPIPPSIRYAPAALYKPSGFTLPCMVAAVLRPGGQVQAVHRTYLRGDGSGKANVSTPRMALGPITGCAVRLAPPAEPLCLCEGIEDGLALAQMTGRACWAVLGTAGFAGFIPPFETRTIVLAPDADPAGDGVVADAAARLGRSGLRVLRLRPRDGADWCEAAPRFEERAAILEYDTSMSRADAERFAFAEMVGRTVRDA